MKRAFALLLPMALTAAIACQDSGSPTSTTSTQELANAFASLPVGFSSVQSTFGDSTDSAWTPNGGRGQGDS